jgi:putative membrane protein
MKRTFLYKLFFGLTLFAALSFSLTSCKNDKPVDTEEAAEESNEAKFDDVDDSKEKDSEFLVDAAELDLQEIQLGKLAQQRATSADVKAHGKMMEDEHTIAANALKVLAEAKGITIPTSVTEDGMDAYNKLNDKKGADFDEAYIDDMVKGHKDGISKFESNIERTTDPEIKAWATKTLGTLKMHLDHTTAIQDKMKK